MSCGSDWCETCCICCSSAVRMCACVLTECPLVASACIVFEHSCASVDYMFVRTFVSTRSRATFMTLLALLVTDNCALRVSTPSLSHPPTCQEHRTSWTSISFCVNFLTQNENRKFVEDVNSCLFIIRGNKARVKENAYRVFVYYESIKRKLNKRLTLDCRCDTRLKAKAEGSTRLEYTGWCLCS